MCVWVNRTHVNIYNVVCTCTCQSKSGLFTVFLLCALQGCRVYYIPGGQQTGSVPHERGAAWRRSASGGRISLSVLRAVGCRALPGGGAHILQDGAERQPGQQSQGAQETPQWLQVHGQTHQQRIWQEEEISVRCQWWLHSGVDWDDLIESVSVFSVAVD